MRTRSAYVAVAAALLAACGESSVGERAGQANDGDGAASGDAGLAAPVDSGGATDATQATDGEGGSADGSNAEASSEAGSPINTPFGACEPQPLTEVCSAGSAGCTCAWSEPELLSDTAFGFWDYAIASDGLGGALVLYTSTTDELARLLRFDPASEGWDELSGTPAVLPQATLAANGCGRVMLAGTKPGMPESTLVFVHDVPTSAWSAGYPTDFGAPLSFHMNPRGNAVVLSSSSQFWSARVFDPASGAWSSSSALGMSLASKAGVIDARGNFADAWNIATRFTAAALYMEWYEVAAAQWSATPELRLSLGGGSAYPVFDENGALHAIWSAPSTSGGSDAIWTAHIDRAAHAVVGAALLSSSSGSDQALNVGSTPQGTAVAAWAHQLGSPSQFCWASGCEVLASTFDGATGTWSAPQPIASNAGPPKVASSSNGSAVAMAYPVTGSDAGTAASLAASYLAPSSGWSAPEPIAPPPTLTGFWSSVRIVMNDRGDAFVFWMDDATAPSSSDARALWSVRYACRASTP